MNSLGPCLLLVVALGALGCGDGKEEPPPDTQAPKVLSTVPAADAVGVAVDAKVIITFDEGIDRTSLNADLFYLTLNAQPRYGNVSYDQTLHQATLVMISAFERGETYQAVLEAGVRDLAGNRMAAATRWSFTVQP
jgi:hypothetical protein